MRNLWLGLIVFFLVSGNLAAADPKAEVEKAERGWADGIVRADLEALDKLLAPDLVYTHSSGDRDSKASYMERIRTGKLKYSKVDYKAIEAYLLKDDVAFVAMRAEVHVQSTAASVMQLSVLHVFVQRQGRWQLVAHQSARLP